MPKRQFRMREIMGPKKQSLTSHERGDWWEWGAVGKCSGLKVKGKTIW